MPTANFDRDAQASWYAREHLKTDPGIVKIVYLSEDAPEREIRLVEVNHLIAEIDGASGDFLDFGADTGSPAEHKLFVVDVTPSQWDAVQRGEQKLPGGWSLAGATEFTP